MKGVVYTNNGKKKDVELEVLLPVYNEAPTIENVISEIYEELSPRVSMRFIISEDGSTDNTKEILHDLSTKYPIEVISSKMRKGYSRALIDGMKCATAPWILCLDADGQCDPRDFWMFWKARSDYDVLCGWRTERADKWIRIFLSTTFRIFYKILFHIPLHDPSFCYVLVRREVIRKLLPYLGHMKQGFWWEFNAVAYLEGCSLTEFPVHHRRRHKGDTKVYGWSEIPKIAFSHIIALFIIRRR